MNGKIDLCRELKSFRGTLAELAELRRNYAQFGEPMERTKAIAVCQRNIWLKKVWESSERATTALAGLYVLKLAGYTDRNYV